MPYQHTQHGSLHLIVLILGSLMCVGACMLRGDQMAFWILAGTALLMGLLGCMFGSLTVRDEGDCLAVRYGPIPFFKATFNYKEITEIAPDRTTWIDGWGIHWVPGRGTTYNLWGFSCVRLTLGKKVCRVGSDDVDNLVAFLKEKIEKN